MKSLNKTRFNRIRFDQILHTQKDQHGRQKSMWRSAGRVVDISSCLHMEEAHTVYEEWLIRVSSLTYIERRSIKHHHLFTFIIHFPRRPTPLMLYEPSAIWHMSSAELPDWFQCTHQEVPGGVVRLFISPPPLPELEVGFSGFWLNAHRVWIEGRLQNEPGGFWGPTT